VLSVCFLISKKSLRISAQPLRLCGERTLATLIFSFLFTLSSFGQVPYERIRNAEREPNNWLTYSGNYASHHYSSLHQINRANVAQLKVAWMYQVRGRQHFETTPLVFDGVMYITDPPSDVTALDLRTGRPIWHYRRNIPPGVPVCCGQVNRGVAALGDQIFVNTIDAHLVALDAKTGRVRWDAEVADWKLAYSMTAAPLAIKDKIIVGIAGAEYGVRGFLDAYDPKSGQRLWRFWTTPGPGEPGNETWSGDSWQRGGATTWVTGSYDPEMNLLYWGTGNPGPDYDGSVRLGDNLYSDSVIALDADTGKLKWHFQFTPHDVNDMDSNQIPVLLDANWQGRPRKLMLFANRNAFYYVLDRATGEFLHAKQFTRQTWAKGLDAKGRPIPDPMTAPNETGALVYPDDDGTSNWFNPSYSPRTKLFYQNVREKGGIYFKVNTEFQPGRLYLGAVKRDITTEEPYGTVRAWQALTGELAWRFELQSPPWGGLLATAGDVVFSGSMEGDFFALDALTGKPLWRFQTGGEIWSNPMSYQFEGEQFVSIAAGSSLIVFSLDAPRRRMK
jgi:alcohol dehydrogenase (cytochrome c)